MATVALERYWRLNTPKGLNIILQSHSLIHTYKDTHFDLTRELSRHVPDVHRFRRTPPVRSMAHERLEDAADRESEPSTRHEAWSVAVRLVAEGVDLRWGGRVDV